MANKFVIRGDFETKGDTTISGSAQITNTINDINIDISGSLNQQINNTALALAIAL
jgi:hypothetical protein